jgi:hypothetical protein
MIKKFFFRKQNKFIEFQKINLRNYGNNVEKQEVFKKNEEEFKKYKEESRINREIFDEECEDNKIWYYTHLKELKKKYYGKIIGIDKGKLLAVDENPSKVWKYAYEGHPTIFVVKVGYEDAKDDMRVT